MRKILFKSYELALLISFIFPYFIFADTDLSACGTLSIAGTYNLTQNISSGGTCIIVGNNVTINGNGFSITGDIISPVGDAGSPAPNLTLNNVVINGTVQLLGQSGSDGVSDNGVDALGGADGAGGMDGGVGENGGNAGSGATNGANAGNGGQLTLVNSTINGNILTSGGNGGRGGDAIGGNGGNGGNGGDESAGVVGNGGQGGNGGNGGPAGNGGVGGNAGSLFITNSKITGTITNQPGSGGIGGSNHGGYGGQGGTGGTWIGGIGGNGGGGGSGGNGYQDNGSTASGGAGTIAVDENGGEGGAGGAGTGSFSAGLNGDAGLEGSITISDSAPTITLVGASTISLNVGDTYTELGATASDTKDGTLTPVISGDLDVNTPGTYTKTYTATDNGSVFTYNGSLTTYQAPQSASVIRTIIVNASRSVSGSRSTAQQSKTAQQPILNSVVKTPLDMTTPSILEDQKPENLKVDTVSFDIDLQLHNVHPDILRLQKFLNKNNFFVSDKGAGATGLETNYFGLKTYNALTRFQKSVGLPQTGFFGPQTRGYVNTIIKKNDSR